MSRILKIVIFYFSFFLYYTFNNSYYIVKNKIKCNSISINFNYSKLL